MTIPFIHDKEPPQHILLISTHADDTLEKLSQKTAHGTVPLYTITQDLLQENMEIRHAKDQQHTQDSQPTCSPPTPTGHVKFRFISSKMHLVLHGISFNMKRRSPMGGHFFQYPGVQEMQWKSSTFMGSGLKLVDSQGRTVACTKRSMGGLMGGGPSALHIFDKIDDGLLMDLIVVTGLAAIEYRRQSDEGWSWLEEVFG